MSQIVVAVEGGRHRWTVMSALGIGQILAWGSYYLLAVLAVPIARDTEWSPTWIVDGLSLGFLVFGVVSPRVGRAIERFGGRPVLMTSAVLLALGLLGGHAGVRRIAIVQLGQHAPLAGALDANGDHSQPVQRAESL